MTYTVDKEVLRRTSSRLADEADEITRVAGGVPAADAGAMKALIDPVVSALTSSAKEVATDLDAQATALLSTIDVATYVDQLSATDAGRVLARLDNGVIEPFDFRAGMGDPGLPSFPWLLGPYISPRQPSGQVP